MSERITGRLKELVTQPLSESQKKLLEAIGIMIFPLEALSISDIKRLGAGFWSNWHDKDQLEELKSIRGEVGVNVNSPFLVRSAKLSLDEHKSLVARYGAELSKIVPGITAMIGEAPDNLAVNFLYKKATGSSLFHRAGGSTLSVTTTLINRDIPLFVGESYNGSHIVSYRAGGSLYSDIKLMPLIVSAPQGAR